MKEMIFLMTGIFGSALRLVHLRTISRSWNCQAEVYLQHRCDPTLSRLGISASKLSSTFISHIDVMLLKKDVLGMTLLILISVTWQFIQAALQLQLGALECGESQEKLHQLYTSMHEN